MNNPPSLKSHNPPQRMLRKCQTLRVGHLPRSIAAMGASAARRKHRHNQASGVNLTIRLNAISSRCYMIETNH